MAMITGAFAIVGCNGFGRVVETRPVETVQIEDTEPNDSKYTIIRLYFLGDGVQWTLDGKDVSSDQVIPLLEKRLKDLSAEQLRIIVTHPKNWSGKPNPTLLKISEWAKVQNVSVRTESATGHIRGVTFGRKSKELNSSP